MRKESSFLRARALNKKEFHSLLNPCVSSSRERRELSFPNFNRKSSISFHYLILPKKKDLFGGYSSKDKINLLTIFSKPKKNLFELNSQLENLSKNLRTVSPKIKEEIMKNQFCSFVLKTVWTLFSELVWGSVLKDHSKWMLNQDLLSGILTRSKT